MLNVCAIAGRICETPELRMTGNGVEVCTATLACERDFKDSSGKRETDFVSCVMWRNAAKYFCQWGNKGDMAIITGRLQSRKWTDKNGNNRIQWEIQSDNVYFCGKREKTQVADDFEELDDEMEGELPFK